MNNVLFKKARVLIDPASLVFFRVAFGVLMLYSTIRFMLKGWVSEYYVDPSFHFSYLGFSWVQPWPEWGMYAHFMGLAVLAICIAAGLFYRVSITLFFLGFTYVELIDKTFYLNHYYAISLFSFLMIFLPLHQSFSLDSMRRKQVKSLNVFAWHRWVLMGQISIIYVFAGLAKVNSDWLLHAQPLKYWMASRTHLPIVGPFLDIDLIVFGMAWFAAAYDLTIPLFLISRKTRPFAYATVILFHGLTAILFCIGVFPWVMMVLTLVFFDPSWPRKLFHWRAEKKMGKNKLKIQTKSAQHASQQPIQNAPKCSTENSDQLQSSAQKDDQILAGGQLQSSARKDDQKLAAEGYQKSVVINPYVIGAIAVFFVFQIIMPMRYLMYPGHLFWTEQGFRFSWRVMLIEKNAMISFLIKDPASGKEWHVSPNEHLTPMQATMMASQPDMILQFSHYLRDTFNTQGRNVEVFAKDSYASLNGRPSQPFINPMVNLAKEHRSLKNKTFILPFDPN